MRIVLIQTNTPMVQGVYRESTPFWPGRGDGGMVTFPKTHFKLLRVNPNPLISVMFSKLHRTHNARRRIAKLSDF